MKILIQLIFILSLFIYACEDEKENEDEKKPGIISYDLKLVFSGQEPILAENIECYDSSTHILYLKNEFKFSSSKQSFYLVVGNDSIYRGKIHSCALSSLPADPIYISDCMQFGNKLLKIDCYDLKRDKRNDTMILKAFKLKGLLRNGLSVKFENIKITPLADCSEIITSITVKNHDTLNYYIPTPEKVGDLVFNYYTGGLFIQDLATKVNYFLRWSIPYPDYTDINLKDLYLLKAGEEKTFSFTSSDYHKLNKGNYSIVFRYLGFDYYNMSGISLEQKDGRIFVGEIVVKNPKYVLN